MSSNYFWNKEINKYVSFWINSSLLTLGSPGQATMARLRAACPCVRLRTERKWGKTREAPGGEGHTEHSLTSSAFPLELTDLCFPHNHRPPPTPNNLSQPQQTYQFWVYKHLLPIPFSRVCEVFLCGLEPQSMTWRQMIGFPALTSAFTAHFLTLNIKITIATSNSCGKDSQRFHTMVIRHHFEPHCCWGGGELGYIDKGLFRQPKGMKLVSLLIFVPLMAWV